MDRQDSPLPRINETYQEYYVKQFLESYGYSGDKQGLKDMISKNFQVYQDAIMNNLPNFHNGFSPVELDMISHYFQAFHEENKMLVREWKNAHSEGSSTSDSLKSGGKCPYLLAL